MATRFDVIVGFPDNNTRMSLDLEGVTFDEEDLTDEEAADAFVEVIRNTIQVTAVGSTYTVTVELAGSVEFEYEDEGGEYGSADAIIAAIEDGELLWGDYESPADVDWNIENVGVDEN